MNLRKRKPLSFNIEENFYLKYGFSLKKDNFINLHNNKTYKIYRIDRLCDTKKFQYKVVNIDFLNDDVKTNEFNLMHNFIIIKENIDVNDILYCIKYNDIVYYCQYCTNANEIYEILSENSNTCQLFFVPNFLYNILILNEDIQNLSNKKHVKNVSIFKSVTQTWDYENSCFYCNFVFLKSHNKTFRSKCCLNGKFIKHKLTNNLFEYCNLTKNELFLKYQYIYNNLLAFGRLGCDKAYDSHYVKTQGGSKTLQGRTYLTYSRPNESQPLVFFFNGVNFSDDDTIFNDLQKVLANDKIEHNLHNHLNILNDIREEMFYCNQLAYEYVSIYESMQNSTYDDIILHIPNEKVSIYDISHFRLRESVDPAYHIHFKNNTSKVIKSKDPYYETVAYPFLFCRGERGFSEYNDYLTIDGSKITKNQYVTCQILMPEPNIFYINPLTFERIECNRFNVWTQLSQYYLVDQLSRFIDSRIEIQQQLNKTHFSFRNKLSSGNDSGSDTDNDSDDDDDLDNEGNDGKKTILGECITGSMRHLRKLSLNSMHIVSEKGRPHIFLTLTTDSNSKEIIEKIGEGQSAFSRPDVTMMVYNAKINALIHNIRHGKYLRFSINLNSTNLIMNYWKVETINENIEYHGTFNVDNEYDGNGKLLVTDENGILDFDGHFLNGKRNGFGTFKQLNNVIYTGYFENDIVNGDGTLKIVKETLLIEESVSEYNDVFNRTKEIITIEKQDEKYVEIHIYSGIWKNGKMMIKKNDNIVKIIQFDGIIFEGCLNDNGLAEGHGKLLLPDSIKFEGKFLNNILTLANKMEYDMRVTEYQHRFSIIIYTIIINSYYYF